METEQMAEHILERLTAHAALLWGENDVEHQLPSLQRTAEEIAIIAHYTLPPDLEPRFF